MARDLSAKNFGIAGIFIILLLLAGLMGVGFMTYLAWRQENAWPSSTYGHSGRTFAAPIPKAPHWAPAILLGRPPIPAPIRQAKTL